METSSRKRIIVILVAILILFGTAWAIFVRPSNKPEERGTLKAEFVDNTYIPPENKDSNLNHSQSRRLISYARGIVYKSKLQEWVIYDGQSKTNLGAYGEGALDISQDSKHFSIVRENLGVIFDVGSKQQLRSFTGSQAVWRNDGSVIILKTSPDGTSTITVESIDGQVLHSYTGTNIEEVYAIGENIGLMSYNEVESLVGNLRIINTAGNTVKEMAGVEVYNVDSQKKSLLLRENDKLLVVDANGKMVVVDSAQNQIDSEEQTNFALHGDILQIARANGVDVKYQILDLKTNTTTEYGVLADKPIPTNISNTPKADLVAGFENKLWKLVKK